MDVGPGAVENWKVTPRSGPRWFSLRGRLRTYEVSQLDLLTRPCLMAVLRGLAYRRFRGCSPHDGMWARWTVQTVIRRLSKSVISTI